MVSPTGSWNETEVETFLEESTIPIRIGATRKDGSLWITAVWYRYRDGKFECATNANAALVRILRDAPEVAFDVSTNKPPYRGVRGFGMASLSEDTNKDTLRALIERYLGTTDTSLARWLLDESREEIRIRIRPYELFSWDFTDRMSEGNDPRAER